jgi:hypothetical protein
MRNKHHKQNPELYCAVNTFLDGYTPCSELPRRRAMFRPGKAAREDGGGGRRRDGYLMFWGNGRSRLFVQTRWVGRMVFTRFVVRSVMGSTGWPPWIAHLCGRRLEYRFVCSKTNLDLLYIIANQLPHFCRNVSVFLSNNKIIIKLHTFLAMVVF